ncbi:MAG: HEPN domain-containing protein [Planctomycetota bacterium]|jgi:HEPN domain-containing protein|nr:HEPN domain-containing protein [Planctomycetota bacterium]MDP7251339.1 HEPN domain-containing protein [Planctomycetota bacterium]
MPASRVARRHGWNLELAAVERPRKVFWEALCFHTQQAAEKALKALLIAHGISSPKTHNIRTLLDLLPPDRSPPPAVVEAASLTGYAVTPRYPGDYEAEGEEEYHLAMEQAEAVVNWVQQVIQSSDDRCNN